MYANKITIPSDGSELKLVDSFSSKDKKQKVIRYQYTKGEYKKGMTLDLTEKEYEDLLRKNIFKQQNI